MPDLNAIKQQAKEKVNADDQALPVNYENVKKCWDEFCIAKKSQGFTDEFVTLSNAIIESNSELGDLVIVEFDYQDNHDHFLTFKDEYLKQLRRKMRNDSVLFEVRLKDRSNEKSKIFTDEDKFKYIAEKYPNLNDLQKRLGLDFEY